MYPAAALRCSLFSEFCRHCVSTASSVCVRPMTFTRVPVKEAASRGRRGWWGYEGGQPVMSESRKIAPKTVGMKMTRPKVPEWRA